MTESHLTRRQLLQSCAAAATAMPLTSIAARASYPYGQRANLRVKNLIWIEVNGGLSQLDTFDPKPKAPEGYRSPYRTIQTKLPGVYFTELLPRLAALADKIRLIRSMCQIVPSVHVDGSHRIMTGQSDAKKDHPYFGSVVAKLHPATRPVPSYVWIQEGVDLDPRYQQGGAYAPFVVKAGWGAESAYGANYARVSIEGTLAQAQKMASADLRRRQGLLHQVMPYQNKALQEGKAEDFRQHQEKALELLTSNDTRDAFAVECEPHSLREKYGLTPIGQNLLIARRLLERGVRAVGLPAWAGDYPGHRSYGGGRNNWDHHYYGMFRDDFAGGYGWMVPRVDRAIAALIEDLEQRGMLSNTLIVLTSEMGSDPRIGRFAGEQNNLPSYIVNDMRGRGHWPQCWTALLAGAGVTGGVYGRTDGKAAYPEAGNEVSPETFGATIYQALGIPPHTLLDPANPLSKVSSGEPLMEVLS